MNVRLANALEGRYTIDREIGAGGMATVYLARDVRHKRYVALKVLNPELGVVLGAERFLAEIQVTANLQHPNLLPLFDSGEVDGMLFYVMPYVEGESLRARLQREKQLPVDEAIHIASTLAGALSYAHRNQVIHRDLKPENILMHEGQPMIADFGIALAVSIAGGARITQTGLSLGTPQYMSPEQATGDRAVDARTDVYSLGAITYEMLVGDPPHVASTSQAIIAKLLTERPASVRSARPTVPQHVDAAIACALEKLPADRFATAKHFADAIGGTTITTSGARQPPLTAASAGTRRTRLRELVAWSIAGVLAAALIWNQVRTPEQVEPQVVRMNFDLPPATHINDVVAGTTIAVSPHGDMMAFTTTGVSGFHLYLRRMNELVSRQLTSAAARNLTFSPDSRWIAFTEGNVLHKISVDGGQAIQVSTTAGSVPYGMAWSAADTIYIGSFSGLWAVSASGGTPLIIAGGEANGLRVGQRWPVILPGNRTLAYVTGSNSSSTGHLATLALGTGKTTEFPTLAAMPLGVLHGQMVYASASGSLMAVPWDSKANRPAGEPVQLDERLLIDPTAGAKAALSASGTLAYLRGRAEFQAVLDRGDNTPPVPLIREPGSYATPRFSPTGDRVAFTIFGPNATDIWIYHVGRNTFTRLTTEGLNVRPEWTADGHDVIFVSTRNGKTAIWRQPADGSGPAKLLYQPRIEPFEALMSPDMKWLIYRTAPGAEQPRDIIAVPLVGEPRELPLVSGPFTETMPRLSPDGKWLAYLSNESGRFEIYVRPFPNRGARVQVSDQGGTEPLWAPSGKAVYFRGSLGEVMRVGVTTGSEFSIGERSVALSGDYLTDASHASYDVTADGRFLMLKRAGAESQTIVVHNWGSELRQRTGSRR